MSIQKIVDYVMHTPHNANPAILKQVINDNISWNDLKDKPFGTETETFTLLENGRVSSVDANEGNPTGFPVERVFAIGDVVNIVWNGEKYTGTAQNVNGDIGVLVVTEASGEDGIFICTYDDGGQPYCYVYSNVSGTLSITVTREIVHAIDPKYLPNYDLVIQCGQDFADPVIVMGSFEDFHNKMMNQQMPKALVQIAYVYGDVGLIVRDYYPIAISTCGSISERRYDITVTTGGIATKIFSVLSDGTVTLY